MKIAFLSVDSRDHFKEYSKPEPYFGTAPQALLDGLEQMPELEVHVISCMHEPAPSPEKIGRNLYYHALPIGALSRMRTGYFGARRAINRLLARLKPDVVHGQGSERENALAAATSGYPNLLTIHGNIRRIARMNHARPLSYFWTAALFEKIAIQKADGVVCISTHTLREVEGLARKTWLIPNAVDVAFFGIERKPAQETTLICVGSILPLKNQLALIYALDSVVREHPLRLIFAGVTQETEYGRTFRREVEARPWCENRGFLDVEALRTLMSEATALIHPSLEENCPMAILEAMAARVPVLASNVGGIPDLLDATTGWLFDPQSPAEMQRCVRELLASPARAEELARAARKRAETRFHPLEVAREHVRVYREVLSGSRRRDS